MAITDYASLQASIASWLHRDDLTAVIPDFIAIAEDHLSADLEAREMEIRYPITIPVSGQYITLPNDVLEIRRVMIFGDPNQILTYATPDEIAVEYPSSLTMKPLRFSVIGNEMQFAPISDAAYTGEIVYRQALVPLSTTNAANWLLTKYPNAYLYASLLAAQFFVEDQDKFQLIQSAYQAAINNINSVDWYTGSTMAVRAH